MNLRLSFVFFLLILFTSCVNTDQPKVEVIGPRPVKVENGILTPEVLWSFGRLGESVVSPSGTIIAYTVTWYSVDKNSSNSELFIMNVDGSNKKQLTNTDAHEYNPAWVNDNTIAFLSTEGETVQIWTINIDGSGKKKVSSFESDINGFQISPKGDKLLFISEVKVDKGTSDIYSDLPKASGMMYSDLMYRH